MSDEPARCGHPKKSGDPCKCTPMRTPTYDPQQLVVSACFAHLTTAEKAELAAAKVRSSEALAADLRAEMARCWDWPITDQHRERARAAVACEELERGEELATALLVDWQDERCAICGRSRGRQVTDHDHETGLVRGILCERCNWLEPGGMELSAFARYRTKNPASMLGLQIRYWDPFRGYAKPRVRMLIDGDHPVYLIGRLLDRERNQP